jgi:hypothetical protein
MVYDLLLGTNPSKVLTVRNITEIGDRIGTLHLKRSPYNITVRCGNYHENLRSTYIHGEETKLSSLAVMRVNRQVYTEMAAFLYSTHIFDFGRDIEAVIPFLQDRNSWSRSLFREIRLRVRSPLANLRWMSDQTLWRKIYRYLDTIGSLQMLTIVVEGDQGGCCADPLLSCSSAVQGEKDKKKNDEDSETMEWATNLPSVGVIKDIRVVHAAEGDHQCSNIDRLAVSDVGLYPPLVPLDFPIAVGSVSSWRLRCESYSIQDVGCWTPVH